MISFVLKKIVVMLLTLLLVSACIFLVFSLIPGDPALRKLGTEGTPQQLHEMRQEMGLLKPLSERYGEWLLSLIHGDMGRSYFYEEPVGGLIAEKLPLTGFLSLFAFVLTVFFSLPLGILCARFENGFLDKTTMVFSQLFMAFPPFFSGMLFSALFGLVLHWFVPGAYVSYREDIIGFLCYLVLPAFTLALPRAAMATRLLRSSMLSEEKKDYTRTAYSRGNTVDGVLYHHVLRNAILPVINFYGLTLSDLVAGSIVIEKIFKLPGISTILITSIHNRDYPVVEGILMGLTLYIIAVNFAVDLICRVVDPRVDI